MPPAQPDPYKTAKGAQAKPSLPKVHDPTPKAVAGKGNIVAQDYTKHIKWTPTKVAVFAFCTTAPYLIAVATLWIRYGFGAAALLLIVGVSLGLFIGLMYWFARSSF